VRAPAEYKYSVDVLARLAARNDLQEPLKKDFQKEKPEQVPRPCFIAPIAESNLHLCCVGGFQTPRLLQR
jgi:hypothetical protein